MRQRTLSKEVTIGGIGLHTGAEVSLTIKPADENSGIQFVRSDLEGNPVIPANLSQVYSTNRSTTIRNGSAIVNTVEHILSALAGMMIDNASIELDGPEVPILDGSAIGFVEMIKKAGIVEQEAEKEFYEIKEPISFKDEKTGTELLALPSDSFEITTLIDFNSEVLGQQYASLDSLDAYESEIAGCRTFVFLKELESLLSQDLIKGGDFSNAIVIANSAMGDDQLQDLAKKLGKKAIKVEKEGILNTTKLKFENEPARHKLLDIIGDLALLGMPIKGKIVAKKPGHKANIEFAKLLRANYLERRKLKGMPVYSPQADPLYNTEQIQELIPHRHPFLLIDKIMELTDEYVVGIKNVTFTEAFFEGHFPGNPAMPGVLQIEALAQTGGIFALSKVEEPERWSTYFIKIDNTKFRQKVLPGDTLILKMELAAPIRRGICQMKGTAYVGNKVACEGILTAQILKEK